MKCPRCKVNMLESVRVEPVIGVNRIYDKKTVYLCPTCGYRIVSK